ATTNNTHIQQPASTNQSNPIDIAQSTAPKATTPISTSKSISNNNAAPSNQEAFANKANSAAAIDCEVCDDADPTVVCAACALSLCSACDIELHKPVAKQSHTRKSLALANKNE